MNIFQNLESYDSNVFSDYWQTEVPVSWKQSYGRALLAENKVKNSNLDVNQVLSLSYGKIIKKSSDKLHGLVPASFENYQIIQPGNIIIRPTDLQNDQTSIRVGLAKDTGIITSAYIGLLVKGDWTPEYAYLYLATIDSTKRIYGMGSGLRQQLSWDDLRWLPCLVPPREEQEAIVRYLAHAHQRIDTAIATKRRLISLLSEERKATVRLLVKSKPHWESQRIGNVFDNLDYRRIPLSAEIRGGMARREYDYYGASGIIDKVEDFIFDEPTILIAEDGANLVMRNLPLAIKATGKYWVNNHAHILRPRFGDIDFYVALLEMIDYRPLISGAAQPKLTQDRLKAVRIFVPSLEEQREIVARIEAETAVIDKKKSLAEREIKLLEEFKTRLTADVVTGQLDVRAIAATLPDLESAPPDLRPPPTALSYDEYDAAADEPDLEDESID